MEDGSLTRRRRNSAIQSFRFFVLPFPRSGIGLDDVAAEEIVHLSIAVQTFGSASLASLRVDEDFIGHHVKQVHELLLLKLDDFDAHEEVGFGLVVRINDRLDESVENEEYYNRLLNSELVMLNHMIALHEPMREVNNLPNDQMWHVIYVHEVCAEEILN